MSRRTESTHTRSQPILDRKIRDDPSHSDTVAGPSPTDVQALKLQRRQTRRLKLFEPALVKMATIRSFVMLDPRNMARNPVMFLVEAGWVLTTLVTIESIADRRGHAG